jgi:hypothetical protein
VHCVQSINAHHCVFSVFLSAVKSDCTLYNRYRKTLLLPVTVQTVLMHNKTSNVDKR